MEESKIINLKKKGLTAELKNKALKNTAESIAELLDTIGTVQRDLAKGISGLELIIGVAQISNSIDNVLATTEVTITGNDKEDEIEVKVEYKVPNSNVFDEIGEKTVELGIAVMRAESVQEKLEEYFDFIKDRLDKFFDMLKEEHDKNNKIAKECFEEIDKIRG